MRAVSNVSRVQYLNWGAAALWAQLEPLLPGLTMEVLPSCVSTNAELLRRIRATAGGRDSETTRIGGHVGRRQADSKPCLLVAEHQTGGRGRMEREWRSSPGKSLTFSLALPLVRADWSGLSLAVGVALVEALQPDFVSARPMLGLKWPNDLWLVDVGARSASMNDTAFSGRKVGGVLIETLNAGSQRFAVVGVGLNILPLRSSVLAGLQHDVASLYELDPEVNAPDVLARIAMPLLVAIQAFEKKGFSAFAARYAARDILLDQPVSTTDASMAQGWARGVSTQGALLVETASGLRSIISGDVSVRLTDAVAHAEALR